MKSFFTAGASRLNIHFIGLLIIFSAILALHTKLIFFVILATDMTISVGGMKMTFQKLDKSFLLISLTLIVDHITAYSDVFSFPN